MKNERKNEMNKNWNKKIKLIKIEINKADE